MKNVIKYSMPLLAFALIFNSCSSNNAGNHAADSVDSVQDSIKNDTGKYDITSQRDSTLDTATGADTSGLRK